MPGRSATQCPSSFSTRASTSSFGRPEASTTRSPAATRISTPAPTASTRSPVRSTPSQIIAAHATGERIAFTFDPVHKDMLVRGISAVDSTLERAHTIEAFERAYYAENPWLA